MKLKSYSIFFCLVILSLVPDAASAIPARVMTGDLQKNLDEKGDASISVRFAGGAYRFQVQPGAAPCKAGDSLCKGTYFLTGASAGSRQPVSGILDDSGLRLNFKDRRGYLRRLEVINSGWSEKAIVTRIPASLRKECLEEGAQTNVSNRQAHATGTPQILQLSIVTDARYLKNRRRIKHVRRDLLTTVHGANQILAPQTGIQLQILELFHHKQNDPYENRDPAALLAEFQAHDEQTLNLAGDARYLFTGRDTVSGIDKGVIGGAFTSSVCRNPFQSYGYSEDINIGLAPLVMAHEIGHLLGASHDLTGGSLMSSFLSPDHTNVSATSLSQINTYLDGNSSCIEDADVAIFLQRHFDARSRLRLTLYSHDVTLTDCRFALYGAGSSDELQDTDAGTLLFDRRVSEQLEYFSSDPLPVKPRRAVWLKGTLTCGDLQFDSEILKISRRSLQDLPARSKSTFLNALKNNLR